MTLLGDARADGRNSAVSSVANRRKNHRPSPFPSSTDTNKYAINEFKRRIELVNYETASIPSRKYIIEDSTVRYAIGSGKTGIWLKPGAQTFLLSVSPDHCEFYHAVVGVSAIRLHRRQYYVPRVIRRTLSREK